MARRAPADLGGEGRALWRRLHRWLAAERLRLEPHEEPLLAELCRQVDRLATARAALASLEPGSAAWCRLATEERLGRVAYGRLVAQAGLPTGVVPEVPDGAKVVGLSPASRRGSKAAAARWRRQHAS